MSTTEPYTFRFDQDKPMPTLATHVRPTTTQFAFEGAWPVTVADQLYMIQETGQVEAEILVVEYWPAGETVVLVKRGLYGSRSRSHLAGAWLTPMRLIEPEE